MFINRLVGAPAHSHAVARLAMVAAALFVTLIFPTLHQQAQAHDGHDHGAAAATLPAAMLPRSSAVGDEIEAVVAIKGDDLLIYVDRFGDNSPVLKADVVVTIDKIEYRAQAMPDGIFLVQAPKLNKTGPSELVISVQAADFSDLLIASLPVQTATQAVAPPKSGTSSTLLGWRWSVQLGTLTKVLGGLTALAIAAALLLRRKANGGEPAGGSAVNVKSGNHLPPTLGMALAVTLALLLGTTAAQRAEAHEGHDHGGESVQTPSLAGDAPRRLDDGSVFLPKATQRLLSVRTFQVKATSTKPGHVLVGRIIANPNTSGVVQSSAGGRVTPPAAGLPHLGQTVKVGDVLGYVTPAFQAIDSANVAQTAGDLDQQLDLAKTKLERAQRLLATNTGTRVSVEEAAIQVRGLERRRAALGQSRSNPSRCWRRSMA